MILDEAGFHREAIPLSLRYKMAKAGIVDPCISSGLIKRMELEEKGIRYGMEGRNRWATTSEYAQAVAEDMEEIW